jgi:hypothetical protein
MSNEEKRLTPNAEENYLKVFFNAESQANPKHNLLQYRVIIPDEYHTQTMSASSNSYQAITCAEMVFKSTSFLRTSGSFVPVSQIKLMIACTNRYFNSS